MTAAEELNLTHAALRRYVADLRARAGRATDALTEEYYNAKIADEIEARFLTDDAWRRIVAEPVCAFGAHVETADASEEREP